MANPKSGKSKKIFVTVLVITLILTTVGVGVFAFYKMPADVRPKFDFAAMFASEPKDKPVSVTPPGTEQYSGFGKGRGEPEDPSVRFNFPDEMRAVYIAAGTDYLSDKNMDETRIKDDIDAALDAAAELTMNTAVIPLYYEGQAVYRQTHLPALMTNFDILEYIITGARERGMYVYAMYDCLAVENGGKIVTAEKIDSALIDELSLAAGIFADAYNIDGIMLDNYYYEQTDDSYFTYLSTGGGAGFENTLLGSTRSVYRAIREAVRKTAPQIQIGMATEAVWANKSFDERGSATSSTFTALYTGNSDNRSYVEDGLADFVAVKALNATTHSREPFAAVISWWGELADECGVPMYIIHAADKAGSELEGWTEYDELTKQIIAAEKIEGFSGSIYNDLARMKTDPKESISKLLLYYEGKIKAEHVLTELAVTSPEKKTYTTFEQTATFKGASDPNTTIMLNGAEISTDQNGYFTMSVQLKPGLNRFEFVHKGKTDIYNITRQVVVLKEITPTGSMSVGGGMQVTITALAYEDAKVYAVVGGQTITMTKMNEEDDSSDRDSSYVRFAGVYTAPAATTVDQAVGNIMVYGEAQGQKDTKQGSYITVNKKVAIADGRPIVVVADAAETFPVSVINDYSDPNHFPLPKGTYDYTVGSEIVYNDGTKSYSYYRLASDLRVYSNDIKAVAESYGPGGNRISGMTVTSDSRYTKVIFKTSQKVSYKASYSASGFSVAFNYTNAAPSSMGLSQNPLFTAANWSGSTVTFKFAKSGGFLGYAAYYDNDDNLVLRFNNPPEISGSSLAGAKIVIDPGHGGSDPGASGFLPNYPESVITRQIANRVAEELRSRGASVLLLETNTYPKTTVDIRMARARAFDPHMFVSIHCNSAANSSAAGTEIYYFNEYSKALAGYAASSVSSALGTNNRGARFGRYYVTRDTQFPGILAEIGFLSNRTEYGKLLDDSYQNRIATAIADSVTQAFKYAGSSGKNITGTQSSGAAVSSSGSPSGSNDSDAESSSSSGPDELFFEQSYIELEVGETRTITVKPLPEGAAVSPVWEVSDLEGENVVTYSTNGLSITLKGRNTGIAEIYVYDKNDDDIYAVFEVEVYD